MNKKLLLLALPVFMAMSSCTYVQSATVQKKGELLAESTEANEDVFGEAILGGELGLEKAQPKKAWPPVWLPEDTVDLGYQIKFNENGEGSADDTISIRFVAALKVVDGINATWMRALAEEDGTNTAKPFAQKVSNKYYISLANGGNVITAGVTAGYEDYQGFVVYTLLNIPYETYKNAYLGANLILTNSANDAVVYISNFLAVRVEKLDNAHSKDSFKLDTLAYDDKYFLHGIINGSESMIIKDEDEEVVDSTNNHASYTDVTLLSSDYFASFYFSSEAFLYFSHDVYFDNSLGFFKESDTLEGFSSPILGGTYDLSISKGVGHVNHVYTSADSFSENLSMYMNLNNWDYASAKLAIYRFNNGTGAKNWEFLSTSVIEGGVKYYTYTYSVADQSTYPNFIILRLNSSTPNDLNKGAWPDGYVWNQTNDLSVRYGPGLYVNIQNTDSRSENFPVIPF